MNKCSGNCNDINDPYARICFPDVVKSLNIKLFNLMTRTNETRHIEWHENCNCECRLVGIICNNKQYWNEEKCRCECKKLVDKDVCDKGFIWNPSNCDCECDKNCDFNEYLDYLNCKCRKKLADKLIDECTKIIEEVKLAEITPFENKNNYEYNFCRVFYIDDSIFYNFYWNYCLFNLLQLVFD